jgi:3-dehydroquinate synthase
MTHPHHQVNQHVRVDFSYPVFFTRDVFRPDHPLLADTLDRLGERRRHRALCFLDSGVDEHHPALSGQVLDYAKAHHDRVEMVMPPRVVPGGEAIKNDYRLVMEVVDTILECRLCRHSYVVAIGGGAVLDAVGFAASLVHRGLRLVRFPTTVLAQNDSGVGVKNAMNLHGGKNTIGTFAPPFAVINDFSFLATLADREWRDGIAEAFKVAMIKDAEFLDVLCEKGPALKARDRQAMEYLVRRCAELHLEHIRTSGDPFELGQARPLDFGHWSAHRLEAMSNYELSHGSAVAVGLAIDTCYAARRGWITGEQKEKVLRGLEACGLGLWHDLLEQRLGDGALSVLQGADDFREHLGGRLALTFPDGLGAVREESSLDPDLVGACIQELGRRARAATPAS